MILLLSLVRFTECMVQPLKKTHKEIKQTDETVRERIRPLQVGRGGKGQAFYFANLVPARHGAPHTRARGHLGWCRGLESSQS